MTDQPGTQRGGTIVDRIREFAMLHGWAIGAHGSMQRDIDLIAVPWTEHASPYASFINAMELVIGIKQVSDVADKPHGRRGILFKQGDARRIGVVYRDEKTGKTCWDPPLLDISFIDPREKP